MNPERISKLSYEVLLYYKYVPLEDPVQFAKEHLQLCKKLELKGRVLVSHEGINGTLSGIKENTQQYMKYMNQHPLFAEMPFKVDEHDGHAFRRLSVRPRKELVAWHLDESEDISPNQLTGQHVSPKEFYKLLQKDDVIIVDGRNDFEYDLGHFRGAIRPEVHTTREFPAWIKKNLTKYKDHKILTYCTGGVRCEKLSGLLLKEGFKDVVQLDGGIVTYGKDSEVQGQLFEGKCYVFDDRIGVSVNRVDEKIITHCHHCGKLADQYVNCRNVTCDQRHIVCPDCEQVHEHFCSTSCKEEQLARA